MLISNEPIKVSDLQKLVNQFMLNGALVIEMVNNSLIQSKTFSESSRRSCSVVEKVFLKFYRKALVLVSVFNKVAGLRASNAGVVH